LLNFHFRLPTLKVIGESTAWALTVCLQTSLSAPLAPPVLSHGASLQVAWPSVPCPPSATDPKPPVLLSPQTGTSLAWGTPAPSSTKHTGCGCQWWQPEACYTGQHTGPAVV